MTTLRSDDDILMELAVFYETEGLTKQGIADEKIEARFQEFKQRVGTSGVTLVDLTVMIYKKFGEK